MPGNYVYRRITVEFNALVEEGSDQRMLAVVQNHLYISSASPKLKVSQSKRKITVGELTADVVKKPPNLGKYGRKST